MEIAAETRYRRSAAACAFALALAATVFAACAFPFAPGAEAALFTAVNLALLLALAYVPATLQAAPAFLVRSIVWQANARWLALAAALVYWVAALRPDAAKVFFAALTWLAAINLVALNLGRRHWHAHEFAWTLYFAGDLALLVYLSGTLEATMTLATVAAVSAFLLIVSSGHGPRAALGLVIGLYAGILYGGMGWMRGRAIAWFLVVSLAAWWMVREAGDLIPRSARAANRPAAPPPDSSALPREEPAASPDSPAQPQD